MFSRTENFRTFVRFYPVVTALIAINLFLWIFFLLPVPALTLIRYLVVGYNAGVANGEWWRLLTPIFLHAGFSHLFFNSVSLILFAPALERLMGKIRFLSIYLLAGILANIATFLIEPLQYSHVGASGAIFGLFGVFLYMSIYRKDLMDQASSQIAVTILAISLIMTFINANINVVAHLAGFGAGFALAPLFLKKRRSFVHQTFYDQPHKRKFQMRRLERKHIFWAVLVVLILFGLLTRF
ncbi:rhomboid family intramembrane serine protease [Bacillus lacus]|uniref:Rhomboid family intramembrane serine protease n=1 Tax=Metabacillus lacus TaxID=1983721 RepID=A0A7X2LZU3_9BACI|nr:rhomboid family intramembrane serine protease [Metabacillus lacus]MRX72094.1 rhomboid family intramembrane serine protease [Metabacillus lacus]